MLGIPADIPVTESSPNIVQTQRKRPTPAYYHEDSGVPVFKPDMDTFKDFYQFILSIEDYGLRAGLVKVIPPQEWIDQQYTSIDKIQKFQITKPITQQFNCGGLPAGSHRQLNIEGRKSYTGIILLIYSRRVVRSV
jgi:hypothetical protein